MYSWLRPGGYFAVHVVDPRRFDPVLDAANPLVGISLQRYMTERKTDSTVIFNKFIYKSQFEYDKDTQKATFRESFIYPKEKRVRAHVHTLEMPRIMRSRMRRARLALSRHISHRKRLRIPILVLSPETGVIHFVSFKIDCSRWL